MMSFPPLLTLPSSPSLSLTIPSPLLSSSVSRSHHFPCCLTLNGILIVLSSALFISCHIRKKGKNKWMEEREGERRGKKKVHVFATYKTCGNSVYYFVLGECKVDGRGGMRRWTSVLWMAEQGGGRSVMGAVIILGRKKVC